ncbi:Rossmann fold nucleotide-binding protein [Nocardioides nanhaiensis]|uniref:LOG family protein n=1 Tax=Nocardioides nanhaiensis TaxID=1476871 RepID=A0ABP8WTQ2_9ACTN
MRRSRGRVIDVGTVAELERRVEAGARSMRGWRLRRLDLRDSSEVLGRLDPAGALLLGCRLTGADVERLEAGGALVLPDLDGCPVDAYRTTLYTAAELYDDADYPRTLDARAYAWSQHLHTAEDELAVTLHDHAVDAALAAWVAPRRLVGVMGGHAAQRGQPAYDDAARLGRALAAHATVATGGGPGAMEAANLGAALSHLPPAALDDATSQLAQVPSFEPSVAAWVRTAQEVLRQTTAPGGRLTESLGIPTWHYGHEPPNLFATGIAKFFGNPAREALLLEVCDAGIVFLPGAAGTVQEVFQDACENYYADESAVAPMVLLGREFWTETLPAWPLLRTLARGRAMEEHVHLADSVEEAAALVAGE